MPERNDNIGADLYDVATEWVALIAAEPSQQNIAAARSWCKLSPQHQMAFEQARWLFTVSGQLAPSPAAAGEPAKRRSGVSRLGALSLAATLAIAVALGWLLSAGGDYQNDQPTARRISLSDGSVLTLDVDSAIDVNFTSRTRDLTLLNGTALFEVAKDARRPFVVHGMDVTATALGTVYSVRRNEDVIEVVVSEGVVRVGRGEAATAQLRAGQVIRYSKTQGLSAIDDTNAGTALAWTRNRLQFELTPLEEVIAQINRYRPGYVLITDPKLGQLPVSGVFRTDRLDDALQMLEQALPIEMTRITGYLVLID